MNTPQKPREWIAEISKMRPVTESDDALSVAEVHVIEHSAYASLERELEQLKADEKHNRWHLERVATDSLAFMKERDSLQSKLAIAVGALEKIGEWSVVGPYDFHPANFAQETLEKLKC